MLYLSMLFQSQLGFAFASALPLHLTLAQVQMEHSDSAPPPAPAAMPEPVPWPMLTDHIWALHDALELNVPADIMDHPDFNRSVQSFGLAATSFAEFNSWLTELALSSEPSSVLAELRLLWHRAHNMTCQVVASPFRA